MSKQVGWAAILSLAWLVGSAAAQDAGDWSPLFNGRDLSGWQEVGGGSTWEVIDGELVPAQAGGWLSTEREYGDFELSLEFLLTPDSNSGVFLRSPHRGRSSRQGMEIQLIDEHGEKYADLKGWQRCGSLYHVEAAKPGAARRAGEWQSIQIRLVGRHLEITLNDEKIIDTNLDDHPDSEAEHPGLKRDRGYIGLQNYNGQKVRFRNIRLRELPADAK